MHKAAAALLALSLGSLPQLSQADTAYAGLALGTTRSDIWDDVSDLGVHGDDRDRALKLFAGAKLHEYLALELFYTDLGEYSASLGPVRIDAQARTFGLALAGQIPLTEQLRALLKIGLQSWKAEADTPIPGLSEDDSGSDLMYGMGLAYDVSNVTLRAEFERYDIDGIDIDTLSAGIALRF